MAATALTQKLVFSPATTPPPGPGSYLVAYSWHHPSGRGPGTNLPAGQLPVMPVVYMANEEEYYLPGVVEPTPGYRWGNSSDGFGLNEFMRIEAWAAMPTYGDLAKAWPTSRSRKPHHWGQTGAPTHPVDMPGGVPRFVERTYRYAGYSGMQELKECQVCGYGPGLLGFGIVWGWYRGWLSQVCKKCRKQQYKLSHPCPEMRQDQHL